MLHPQEVLLVCPFKINSNSNKKLVLVFKSVSVELVKIDNNKTRRISFVSIKNPPKIVYI